MNRKAVFVALLVSLVISGVLWKQIQKKASTNVGPNIPVGPPMIPKKDVVVAKKMIPSRTRLEAAIIADAFHIQSRVASDVPREAFTDTASLTNRYTAVTILKDDIITPDRIMSEDMIPNLARAIPEGKRAVSLAVTKVTSVGGFIQQGDFVDVIATLNPKEGEPITKIVLQDILVLAVGNTYEFDSMIPSSTPAIAAGKADLVTLAVSPEELERLMFLDSGARFRLILKNPNDKGKRVTTKGTTEKMVLSSMAPKEEEKPVEPPKPPVTPETPMFVQPHVEVQEDLTAPSQRAVVVRDADDGKVKIQYGSKRKEEVYKYGGPQLQTLPGDQENIEIPGDPKEKD